MNIFAVWSRKVETNPNASYGRIVEHSYQVPAPTNLSATAGNARVTVSWSPVSGATGYAVYYSTLSTPRHWRRLMSSDPNAAGMNPVRVTRTTTSTAVTNLSNGTPVFFRASAISKYSKYNPYLAESVSAQAVSATPQAP